MANYNPPTNAFEPGNRLCRKAIRTGRLKKFATPAHLWEEACHYFEYCATSPIPTLCLRRGGAQTIYRIRPMSIGDLCRYLKVAHLDNYKKMPEYARMITRIRYVIYEYNYTRAAAGFLKGRIVSRTLRKEKKTQPSLIKKYETPIAHISTSSPPKTPHYNGNRKLIAENCQPIKTPNYLPPNPLGPLRLCGKSIYPTSSPPKTPHYYINPKLIAENCQLMKTPHYLPFKTNEVQKKTLANHPKWNDLMPL